MSFCREGEQTCDLLCLVALRSLRKSMDIAAERKRGVTDLELLCQEIEQADRYSLYPDPMVFVRLNPDLLKVVCCCLCKA